MFDFLSFGLIADGGGGFEKLDDAAAKFVFVVVPLVELLIFVVLVVDVVVDVVPVAPPALLEFVALFLCDSLGI